MTYRSAVDWWFYAVVFGLVVATIPTIAPLVASAQPMRVLAAVFLLVVTWGLPLWLLASTTYRVDPSALTVRSGPFRWTVPLNEIRSIQPSRSVLSSPALSLDRVAIDYGRGRRLLVSPKDRDGFIADVQRRVAAATSGARGAAGR